jgi:hypothetical protein|tara:strand:- start:639 stop:872 length:234 start_codon:yes stop_codon:yes gene_type:complete
MLIVPLIILNVYIYLWAVLSWNSQQYIKVNVMEKKKEKIEIHIETDREFGERVSKLNEKEEELQKMKVSYDDLEEVK